MKGKRDRVANAANLSALVYNALPELNWVGFYFFDGNELVVGPFQGQPACVRIALGRGVCGTAAATRQTPLVPDVDTFPATFPATQRRARNWLSRCALRCERFLPAARLGCHRLGCLYVCLNTAASGLNRVTARCHSACANVEMRCTNRRSGRCDSEMRDR